MRDVDIADIPTIVAELPSATRLVTIFAEDRVATEVCFYNYYVFERPGDPEYDVLRARIAADLPQFPSLAVELPSVNWQEREIQDWFGLEAVGHPNPRRVALHDDWPDVHPLRKSFALNELRVVMAAQFLFPDVERGHAPALQGEGEIAQKKLLCKRERVRVHHGRRTEFHDGQRAQRRPVMLGPRPFQNVERAVRIKSRLSQNIVACDLADVAVGTNEL